MDINSQQTRVVNLNKSPYDVYIGRAGHGKDGYFGNPFILGQDGDREQVLRKYQEYFNKKMENDHEFHERIIQLKGKTLGCFCKPKLCHGDVIAHYLNAIEIITETTNESASSLSSVKNQESSNTSPLG